MNDQKPVQKSSSRKIWTITLLIISSLIILGLLGLVIWFIVKQSKKDETTTEQPKDEQPTEGERSKAELIEMDCKDSFIKKIIFEADDAAPNQEIKIGIKSDILIKDISVVCGDGTKIPSGLNRIGQQQFNIEEPRGFQEIVYFLNPNEDIVGFSWNLQESKGNFYGNTGTKWEVVENAISPLLTMGLL